MKPNNAVCNYAMLRFIPYPEIGEVVNVGVLVSCIEPCFLHFQAERSMPQRVKALFPKYNAAVFAAGVEAIREDVEHVKGRIQNPQDCQRSFNELVRPRENTFRYGEVRTILTRDPENLSEELFRRYVRMESTLPKAVTA